MLHVLLKTQEAAISCYLVKTATSKPFACDKPKISNTSASIQVPSDDSIEVAAVAPVQCTLVKQTVLGLSMIVVIYALLRFRRKLGT